MTVLSACQSAMIRLVGRRPEAIFSSTGAMEVELSDLINEVATDIAKAHDWQDLLSLETITGDGTTVNHALPTDYERMAKDGDVHAGSWDGRFARVKDTDQWLELQSFSAVANPGFWFLIGGEMNLYPALASADTAKYYYVRNTPFLSSVGTAKTVATADTDTFVLPERLHTLGLIWRWRAQKKLDYAEDMRNYEIALSQEIGNDRGSRILRKGRATTPGNVGISYPQALG